MVMAMFEITRHEIRQKRKGIVTFSLFVFFFGIMMVAAFETLGAGLDMDELFESYPAFVTELFGKSIVSFGDFGSFITVEYLQWVWYLIVPAYLALFCAGSIAGEVERKTPISSSPTPCHARGWWEKFLAAGAPVLLINGMGLAAILVGAAAVDVAFEARWAVYAFMQATPFLLVWVGAFTLLSVLVYNEKTVSTLSIGAGFGLYVLDVVSRLVEGVSFLGYVSPMHYYDPGRAMALNIVAWGGSIVLVAAAVALAFGAAYVFTRRDISG
jgi:ABC-2 type transport system permease protein